VQAAGPFLLSKCSCESEVDVVNVSASFVALLRCGRERLRQMAAKPLILLLFFRD